MYSGFATLAFVLVYGPWKERLIWFQHVVNEVIFIALCLYLILSTPGVYQDFNRMFEILNGELVIVLVSLYVFFNLLVILLDLAWNWLRLHCIRRENIKSYREQNRHLTMLINRRNQSQALKLNQILKEITKARKQAATQPTKLEVKFSKKKTGVDDVE